MLEGVDCSSKGTMILALHEFHPQHYTSRHLLFSERAGLYSFIGYLECFECRCKKSKGQDIRGLRYIRAEKILEERALRVKSYLGKAHAAKPIVFSTYSTVHHHSSSLSTPGKTC